MKQAALRQRFLLLSTFAARFRANTGLRLRQIVMLLTGLVFVSVKTYQGWHALLA